MSELSAKRIEIMKEFDSRMKNTRQFFMENDNNGEIVNEEDWIKEIDIEGIRNFIEDSLAGMESQSDYIILDLERKLMNLKNLTGMRECDIPACNCGSFHEDNL